MEEFSIRKILPGTRSAFWNWTIRIALLSAILLLFFLSIDLMVQALSYLVRGTAIMMIQSAEMPFIALFIGLLATALVQSSSTVTSITVAIVATNTISLSTGIFIVMGANIGTTITSDIVALGYITKRSEFRKAVSAATVHDFFNILSTLIIFPLEYYYHFLSRTSLKLMQLLGVTPATYEMQVHHMNRFFLSQLTAWISSLIGNHWVVLVLSVILLFLSIKMFSTFSYRLFIGESKDKIKHFIFSNPTKSFTWGMLITGTVQSSSITTSLMVPLVATGKVQLKSVFPFIMGANIGTTITAIMAALLKSNAALSLALGHLIFNLMGVLIFLPLSPVRAFPVYMAKVFSYWASQHRIIGFFYILITFFLLPFILIYLSRG